MMHHIVMYVKSDSARPVKRQMRRFKSAGQAQHFLPVQGVILNFFRFARHDQEGTPGESCSLR